MYSSGGKKKYMYLERVQYSLIYLLYKSKFYKSGKGYTYRANQILGIFIGFLFLLICNLLLVNRLSDGQLALLWGATSFVSFLLLEKHTSRTKMFKWRRVYRNRKRYLIPFFLILLCHIFKKMHLSMERFAGGCFARM